MVDTMALLDASKWTALKPYFDRALDLDDAARAVWLARLREQDQALCGDLEALLEHHRAGSEERFLESPPVVFPPRPAVAGQALGAYTLLSPLGRGGMGTVWLAERNDGRFTRLAAIKFLNVALKDRGEDRFRREGRILGRLTHPHIASLIDAGISDAQPYLVLEHVDGAPIDRYCHEQRLDLHARVKLFLDVLAAVAHAHANLIVHRDLKPSNVLVTKAGEVKLLDFGIAKLLEDDAVANPNLTHDGDLAMTPQFATPEQVTGGTISTATDIYGLGLLLYLLITGQHPAASSLRSPADLMKAIVETEPRLASEVATEPRLRRLLRGDLDTILATSLRKNPADRYPSVTAFADDLRRYLKHEPISARRDGVGYRAFKFIRRNRWPVAAAAVVFMMLAGALYVVNRQRVIAENRFQQLRHLSQQVFSLDTRIRNLPGATEARQALVTVSLAYLEGLAADAYRDVDLAVELADGYWRVGSIQGVPNQLNLGDFKKAESTLQKGAALLDRVLASRPQHGRALQRASQIAHDRMIIAESEHRDVDARALAQTALAHMEAYLRLRTPTTTDVDDAATVIGNVALAHLNMHDYDEGVRLARLQLEVVRSHDRQRETRHISGGLSLLANGLRFQGNLEASLSAIREARAVADRLKYPNDNLRMFDQYGVLLREGLLLGDDRAPSLERPAEALVPLKEAFELVDSVARRDPNDSTSRGRVGTTGREIGDILRWQDPGAALRYYDAAITRLSEIQNNVKARRDRAVVLAESSYALRGLDRAPEAKARLAEAIDILQQTGDYSAPRVAVDSEAAAVMRAMADHDAATGQTAAAISRYEQLLDAVVASQPDVDNDIRNAYSVSLLDESLAQLQRKAGDSGRANAIDARTRALWEHWNRKLPNNAIVQRKLSSH